MKLKLKKAASPRVTSRLVKKARVRAKISGSTELPRLCVFRSSGHMYAQVIDDVKGVTVVSASSLKIGNSFKGKDLAKEVGKIVAKEAIAKNVKSVVFDRNGFLYHGRVKALADGAREGGLQF